MPIQHQISDLMNNSRTDAIRTNIIIGTIAIGIN